MLAPICGTISSSVSMLEKSVHTPPLSTNEKDKQSGMAKQIDAHDSAVAMVARFPRNPSLSPFTPVKGPSNDPSRHPRSSPSVVVALTEPVVVVTASAEQRSAVLYASTLRAWINTAMLV